MGLDLNIPSLKKIYLDTNLYIYFFEANPQYADHVEELLSYISDQNATIISSTLLLTELLVSPYKSKNQQLINTYQDLDQILVNLQFISMNKKISQKAAQLRAKYDIRTPDAVHLATALNQQADLFVTADQQFKKIKELTVLLLDPKRL